MNEILAAETGNIDWRIKAIADALQAGRINLDEASTIFEALARVMKEEK